MNTNPISRREFLIAIGLGTATLVSRQVPVGAIGQKKKRPNILLITVDDMNWDSPGCFGGQTPEITPNIDRLASEGIRFTYAHITIAVCQPCRSVLMTGRYPHRNGAEGFQPINTSVPTLQESLHKAGYLNGILGKVRHLAPRAKFMWDMAKDMGELGQGRDPKLYYEYARDFFQEAANNDQPFFLMANSHDPHRPFHGSLQERNKFKEKLKDITPPSRVYRDEEINVPGFLPDIPDVRKEMAQYYSSVRRCDDTVGAVLRALRESGLEKNTLTMFLSDHGMPLPFAKTNCYLHSTRTPWIARWPGKIRPGKVDKWHFISGIDFMPTILETARIKAPSEMDGNSFLPVLFGRKQAGREQVFTQFHQTSARNRYPMRCVQNKRFGYIFNPWSNNERMFKNESQSGLTFKAMQAAAKTNPEIAGRVRLFQYRVVEELYDFANDPDALHNLADNPEYKKELDKMRKELLNWMQQTNDPALEALENHNSSEALKQFMAKQDAKSGKKIKKKKQNKKRTSKNKLLTK